MHFFLSENGNKGSRAKGFWKKDCSEKFQKNLPKKTNIAFFLFFTLKLYQKVNEKSYFLEILRPVSPIHSRDILGSVDALVDTHKI